MNNSRFAISLHILVLLERAGNELVSSDYLAGSININPVLVRKELINLKKHGFLGSKEGKNGGTYLAKPAELITLAEIYLATRQDTLLGVSKNTPNPNCPVGKQINNHLNELNEAAAQVLIQDLATKTLSGFSKQFK